MKLILLGASCHVDPDSAVAAMAPRVEHVDRNPARVVDGSFVRILSNKSACSSCHYLIALTPNGRSLPPMVERARAEAKTRDRISLSTPNSHNRRQIELGLNFSYQVRIVH